MKLPDLKAPNLPIATKMYNSGQQEQFSRALRLYFNTIDINYNRLVSKNGGHWVSFPHIAASDSTDQYATGNNIPTVVKWNTLDSASGFTLNIDSTATAQYDGVFKIDYSLQFVNTANTQHNVTVWLQVDGIDVPGSATKFSIPQRKSVGNYTYIVAYSTAAFSIITGQKVALYWATDQAYVVSPPTDGVYMEYEAAQTSPYPHPSVPSAIGAIVFVSSIPI